MDEFRECLFCGRERVDLVVDEYYRCTSYVRTYKFICFSCSAYDFRNY